MTLPATDVKIIGERWDKIRQAVRNRWPQLDQTDLDMIDGDSRKLIALVHQKTGAGLSAIEDAIDKIASESDGLLQRVVKSTTKKAAAVSDQVEQFAADVYPKIDDLVSTNPGRSLSMAFGAAFVLGFLMTCCQGSNSSDTRRSLSKSWPGNR